MDTKEKSLVDLHNFIVTVPLMFPPTNSMVKPHEYFTKWEAFDSDAYMGVNGDDLTILLLRGMCFFLSTLVCCNFCFLPFHLSVLSLFLFLCDFCNGGDDGIAVRIDIDFHPSFKEGQAIFAPR